MKLGSVPYLNGMPLIWGLKNEPDVELRCEVPSGLAVSLREGRIAAGLVSVVACFLNPELQFAPGISISSIGPVDSVRLFHKGNVESIRKVALDKSSLTSVVLTKVILSERYGLTPELFDMPPSLPDMLRECDAALVIGDPAMQAYAESEWPSLDLGEEWHELTRLPFVFAGWAVNPKLVTHDLIDILHRSKSVGLSSFDEISELEARRLNLPVEVCLRYLTDIMNYDLTDDHIQGISLFREKAQRLGFVPQGGELKLFGS